MDIVQLIISRLQSALIVTAVAFLIFGPPISAAKSVVLDMPPLSGSFGAIALSCGTAARVFVLFPAHPEWRRGGDLVEPAAVAPQRTGKIAIGAVGRCSLALSRPLSLSGK
jgi:hypothetical protein